MDGGFIEEKMKSIFIYGINLKIRGGDSVEVYPVLAANRVKENSQWLVFRFSIDDERNVLHIEGVSQVREKVGPKKLADEVEVG